MVPLKDVKVMVNFPYTFRQTSPPIYISRLLITTIGFRILILNRLHFPATPVVSGLFLLTQIYH
jgi:hypothetical protein